MSTRNLAGRIAAVRPVERLDRFTAGSDAIVDGRTLSDVRMSAALTRQRARAAAKSPDELRPCIWYRWKERELYYTME